jgi:threonine/homoserine/homoserine lactone efflux protein
MISAIYSGLPTAIGIALSAAPIVAVVLMLVTTRPQFVSAMFLCGWAVGIMTVAGIVIAFVDTSTPRGLPPRVGAVIRIVLGIVLAVLAVRSLRKKTDSPSKLTESLATWSAKRAFAVGFALGSINPKNLALTVSGATAILAASMVPFEQLLAVAVFAAVASLSIATPVVLQAVGGQRVSDALQRASQWMTRNGKTISGIVLAILAVVLMWVGVTIWRGAS